MVMLDTNIILRYLLNDNEQMADEAEKVIKEKTALVTIEIIAEVEVIKLGLTVYSEKNLDFVDCILYAYYKVKGYEIKTFDKKLQRLLQNGI